MTELPASARRVQAALDGLGQTLQVITLPASTRTAPEAAAAVGCQVGQIVKSLVFRATTNDTPILVLASGANRVDEARLADLVGAPITKADAAFVRTHTGYAIGGVAPVGHPQPIRTFIDADLLSYEALWAAAGTPNSVFALRPDDLQTLTDGTVVALTGCR